MSAETTGVVYLVGAGPGEAGLLTEKGRRCLEVADVVVYDRLVSPQILNYARAEATLLYVGKEANHHAVPQDQINEILVTSALRGETVVRLKGGDPFVFGRGGEEALELQQAGVRFEIVPGITSAIGALAYVGIPVTHRQVATSFTVITGHESVSDEDALVDWSRMTDKHTTLIILMGISRLKGITSGLVTHGRSADTPAAVVRWGARAGQQTVVGTLADIAEKVAAAKIKSPGVIVVGDVVHLRDSLGWFERKPLFGQRILAVTEMQDDASAMAGEFAAGGAEAISFSLETFAVADVEAIDEAIEAMLAGTKGPDEERRDWMLRSPLDVKVLFARMRERRLDIRRFAHVGIAAADESTEMALAEHGIVASQVGLESGGLGMNVLDHLYQLCGAAERLRHILSGWSGMPWQLIAESEEIQGRVLREIDHADRPILANTESWIEVVGL